MKSLINISIITLFTFSFCCEMEEVYREVGDYKDGEKHGKWISYCIHDQKINEGNYIDGEKHGKWIFYFENEQIWYEGNFKNGIEDGQFIYYGNGNYNIIHKIYSENYKDGKLNGKLTHYHINEEIGRVENYTNGIKNGTDIFYDQDGRIYWSGNYEDGILINGSSIKSDIPFNIH